MVSRVNFKGWTLLSTCSLWRYLHFLAWARHNVRTWIQLFRAESILNQSRTNPESIDSIGHCSIIVLNDPLWSILTDGSNPYVHLPSHFQQNRSWIKKCLQGCGIKQDFSRIAPVRTVIHFCHPICLLGWKKLLFVLLLARGSHFQLIYWTWSFCLSRDENCWCQCIQRRGYTYSVDRNNYWPYFKPVDCKIESDFCL